MALGAPTGGPPAEDEGGGEIFSEINITPLTDIFLVLLIIFMVTTTAIAEAGQERGAFEVSLPKGGAGEVRAIPDDVAVAILSDGRAVIGGKVLADDALRAAFAEVAGRDAATVVVVQADEGVPHGRVVQVMELARGAGLSRLAIATRTRAEGGGAAR